MNNSVKSCKKKGSKKYARNDMQAVDVGGVFNWFELGVGFYLLKGYYKGNA